MPLVITPQLMSSIYRGFNTSYQTGLLMPGETYYQSVATPMPSGTSEEMYGWLATSTGFREWVGDRVIQTLMTEGYLVVNKEFENTIGVKRTLIEDDRFGVLGKSFEQLGLDAKEHPDQVAFGVLRAGVNEKCYDGKPFFAPDHPVRTAPDKTKTTAVSNLSTEAGDKPFWYVFDTSKVIKPLIWQKRQDYNFVRMDNPTDAPMFFQGQAIYGSDARVAAAYGLWQFAHASNKALTTANFEAVRAAMMNIKRDNGRPANVKPTEIHVPTYWLAAAEALFEKRELDGGGTNTLFGRVKVVHNPYLN